MADGDVWDAELGSLPSTPCPAFGDHQVRSVTPLSARGSVSESVRSRRSSHRDASQTEDESRRKQNVERYMLGERERQQRNGVLLDEIERWSLLRAAERQGRLQFLNDEASAALIAAEAEEEERMTSLTIAELTKIRVESIMRPPLGTHRRGSATSSRSGAWSPMVSAQRRGHLGHSLSLSPGLEEDTVRSAADQAPDLQLGEDGGLICLSAAESESQSLRVRLAQEVGKRQAAEAVVAQLRTEQGTSLEESDSASRVVQCCRCGADAAVVGTDFPPVTDDFSRLHRHRTSASSFEDQMGALKRQHAVELRRAEADCRVLKRTVSSLNEGLANTEAELVENDEMWRRRYVRLKRFFIGCLCFALLLVALSAFFIARHRDRLFSWL